MCQGNQGQHLCVWLCLLIALNQASCQLNKGTHDHVQAFSQVPNATKSPLKFTPILSPSIAFNSDGIAFYLYPQY